MWLHTIYVGIKSPLCPSQILHGTSCSLHGGFECVAVHASRAAILSHRYIDAENPNKDPLCFIPTLPLAAGVHIACMVGIERSKNNSMLYFMMRSALPYFHAWCSRVQPAETDGCMAACTAVLAAAAAGAKFGAAVAGRLSPALWGSPSPCLRCSWRPAAAHDCQVKNRRASTLVDGIAGIYVVLPKHSVSVALVYLSTSRCHARPCSLWSSCCAHRCSFS